MPVVFGTVGVASYMTVRLACAFASIIRPNIQSFSSYHEPTKILMAISSLLASIPVGFVAANLFVYAIPPLRRFFDQEARKRNGEDFSAAMRGLLKVSMYWVPPLIAVCFGAALLGK